MDSNKATSILMDNLKESFKKLNKNPTKKNHRKLTHKLCADDKNTWLVGCFTTDWPTLQKSQLVGSRQPFSVGKNGSKCVVISIFLSSEWFSEGLASIDDYGRITMSTDVIQFKEKQDGKIIRRGIASYDHKLLEDFGNEDWTHAKEVTVPMTELNETIKSKQRIWVIERVTSTECGTFTYKDIGKLEQTGSPSNEWFIIKNQYTIDWKDQITKTISLIPVDLIKIDYNFERTDFIPEGTVLLQSDKSKD